MDYLGDVDEETKIKAALVLISWGTVHASCSFEFEMFFCGCFWIVWQSEREDTLRFSSVAGSC